MKPEAQRIAIAEACGWEITGDIGNRNRYPTGHKNGDERCFIPDYLNDLNAMHQAEKHLDPVGQLMRYIYNLQTLCGGQHFGQNYLATASQRAEAFLKTKNLWTE